MNDDLLNEYLGTGPFIYRFQSDCTNLFYFVKTNQKYDDNEQGMNLFYGGATGCMSTSKCNPTMGVLSGSVVDNNGFSGNNCNRWFQGHLGNDRWACYSTNRRSTSARCFSAGSSCTCGQGVDHPVHKNMLVFVKHSADY
eukprot:m.36710 g.36710  ORF g.36710 m.36710 type:complete len:140 (+) comp10108_c0_seq1:648-1067(+)